MISIALNVVLGATAIVEAAVLYIVIRQLRALRIVSGIKTRLVVTLAAGHDERYLDALLYGDAPPKRMSGEVFTSTVPDPDAKPLSLQGSLRTLQDTPAPHERLPWDWTRVHRVPSAFGPRPSGEAVESPGGWPPLGAPSGRGFTGGPESALAAPNSGYRAKCKRLRLDGPTPCLCCEGECRG